MTLMAWRQWSNGSKAMTDRQTRLDLTSLTRKAHVLCNQPNLRLEASSWSVAWRLQPRPPSFIQSFRKTLQRCPQPLDEGALAFLSLVNSCGSGLDSTASAILSSFEPDLSGLSRHFCSYVPLNGARFGDSSYL